MALHTCWHHAEAGQHGLAWPPQPELAYSCSLPTASPRAIPTVSLPAPPAVPHPAPLARTVCRSEGLERRPAGSGLCAAPASVHPYGPARALPAARARSKVGWRCAGTPLSPPFSSLVRLRHAASAVLLPAMQRGGRSPGQLQPQGSLQSYNATIPQSSASRRCGRRARKLVYPHDAHPCVRLDGMARCGAAVVPLGELGLPVSEAGASAAACGHTFALKLMLEDATGQVGALACWQYITPLMYCQQWACMPKHT
eukprot:366441-Chlamydomonas_euryale.AAC.19